MPKYASSNGEASGSPGLRASEIQFTVEPSAGASGTASVSYLLSGCSQFQPVKDADDNDLQFDLSATDSESGDPLSYSRRIRGNFSQIKVKSNNNADAFDLIINAVDLDGSS